MSERKSAGKSYRPPPFPSGSQGAGAESSGAGWSMATALGLGTVVAYLVGGRLFSGTSQDLIDKAKKTLADEPTEAFDVDANAFLIFADLKPFKASNPKAFEKTLQSTSRLLLLYKLLASGKQAPQFGDGPDAQQHASRARKYFGKLEAHNQTPLGVHAFRKARAMLDDLLDHYVTNVIKKCSGALPIDRATKKSHT